MEPEPGGNVGGSGIGLCNLLDRYVGRQYLKIVTLSCGGLLGIFYISTFVDLSDKLFKGETTLTALNRVPGPRAKAAGGVANWI